MSDRSLGQTPSRLVAVLGPTNTGKTHLAVERMLGHASGMIGLPLRLLAREIYDRVVEKRGAGKVALITGEEKIAPAHPQYFVCTVEAMPLDRKVEFLAVDEVQLCADPERGHIFTHRLMHARAAGRVTRPRSTFDMMRDWIKAGLGWMTEAHTADGKSVGFETFRFLSVEPACKIRGYVFLTPGVSGW